MTNPLLEPWMLRADWRSDRRPWLLVDLADWPEDVALDPLPPVPVIGVGPAAHPQAVCLDALIEPGFGLPRLAAATERHPLTAAALVELLRSTQSMDAEAALTAESFAYAMLQGSAEHHTWLAERRDPPALPEGQVYTEREGAVLTVTIDRPKARNAIDRPTRDAMFEVFSLASLDRDIATIRLRANGRAFGIGADLAEFGTTRDPASAHAIRARTLPARAMLGCAKRCEVLIDGACIGASLELAAFAGRVIATPKAWFQLPELAMGIIPGAGGTVSLPRRIGRQRAALLILSGQRITARTALDWGLVDEVARDDRRTNEVS